MITIYSIDNYKSHFNVSGHAQYAPKGSDIVCAGISAIVEMISHALKRFAECSENMVDGDYDIIIRTPNQKTDLFMEEFVQVMRRFELHYPEYVQIL